MARAKKDDEEAADPSTTSAAYDAMAPRWAMINALLAGTGAMRAAGAQYLPRHPGETHANYNDRLASATLFNMTALTLDTLVGKPFSEEMKLEEDVPEAIKVLTDDIDLRGSDISAVSRNWFREALSKGFAHVLVDMPALDEASRPSRTREDDVKEGRRPFWSLIKPENLIFASTKFVNGEEQYTHVRIYELESTRVGFAEVVQERIRVLEPGKWELYEKRVNAKKKIEWVKIDEGTTSLDFIPLVTFYANRDDVCLAKPPIEDLAFLNVRHWQSVADQTNILTVARFPILAVSGANDQSGTDMVVGPRQFLGTKDPQGRFYYVEHTGAAIESGRREILDLEDRMANYGAEFLKRRSGDITATERALDSSEAISLLQDIVLRFHSAVEKALLFTALWLKETTGGTITINTDFGGIDDEELRTLVQARKQGDISRHEFRAELKERKIVGDWFNTDNMPEDMGAADRLSRPQPNQKPGAAAA